MKKLDGKLFLGFILGVLIMAVVGLSGYIIYNNNSKVDNNKLENNNDINNENNNTGNKTEEKDDIVELSLEADFVKRVFRIHSSFVYGEDLIDYFYGIEKIK